MKKLLLLFIPLMFLFGCEVFENNLDENLFGTWKRVSIYVDEDMSPSHVLGYSFNDNNNYTTYYSAIDTDTNGSPWEIDGEWWIEGDVLWMENNAGETYSQEYSVSGDSLLFYMESPQVLVDINEEPVLTYRLPHSLPCYQLKVCIEYLCFLINVWT